jgi:hypothetical protein
MIDLFPLGMEKNRILAFFMQGLSATGSQVVQSHYCHD